MNEYYITWWNVENLFDIQNSPDRPKWLQKQLNKELRDWNQAILDRKIEQLTKVIFQINDGAGPDLLGVCEVENKNVMDLLVDSLAPLGRNYAVAHHDTSDKRGIDVAFIFDSDKLSFERDFFHVVLKRAATRDLYQVNLRTSSGKLLIALGNHWPSRRGGAYKSEPYRIIAAETMSYWIERIYEVVDKDAGVVVMGDFNDEPFDRSLSEYALSTSSTTKVLNARSPRLLNLCWPLLGEASGTHYFDNFPNVLDQFLVSKGILNGKSGFKVHQRPNWKHAIK